MFKACAYVLSGFVACSVLGPQAQAPREAPEGTQIPRPREIDREGQAARVQNGEFTGDIKLVFYVRDVRTSAAFYRDALGFEFHHYHDYSTGKSVREWTRDEPPIYAELSAGGRRFGLHLPQDEADERAVGRAKVYFRVKDLDAHHRRIRAFGVAATPIRRRPWMDMFRVTDPDGHRIYFAYTDDAVHGNPWTGS